MRKTILVGVIVFSIISGCKKKQVVDISGLDFYITAADSIQKSFSNNLNFTLEGIYSLIDDSTLADSISRMVVLPDTVMFYQLLRNHISEINKISYGIQQELLFAQDQLEGFKEDVLDNHISAIQYEIQLDSEKNMYDLLKERVDSVNEIFQQIASDLFLISKDSILNDKTE